MTEDLARTLDGLSRDYRVTFLRYLARREEVALAAGYALGRAAVADGVSLLELVRIHHEVLQAALAEGRPDEAVPTSGAAADFLLEVLAPFDMAFRQLGEPGSAPG